MTPSPDDSSLEVLIVTEAYVGPERRVNFCPMCRTKAIKPGNLTCGTKVCLGEYVRRFAKVRATKEYRSYVYWYDYIVTHIDTDGYLSNGFYADLTD